MSNLVTGNAANVIVAPARLMIAPIGTALPAFNVTPIVWPVGWAECGYTEDGLQLAYSPTVKEIEVDEELAPIDEFLDKEKATLSAKLAEATLTNLNLAISASIKSASAADLTHPGTETVDVGSGSLNEVMVGFEGLSPKKFWRVMIGYRAKARANVTMTFKRSDKTIIPVEYSLVADSTQAVGKRLFKIVDMVAVHT